MKRIGLINKQFFAFAFALGLVIAPLLPAAPVAAEWDSEVNGRIFYTDHSNEESYAIESVLADGTGHENVINPPNSTETDVKVSPDGTQIVFNSNADGDNNIWKANVDGTGRQKLTNSGDTSFPSWSPDGEQIIYVSYEPGPDREIFIMDADGSNEEALTNLDISPDRPEFSPDGDNIVFISDDDGDSEIYSMDADGENEIQLTNNDVADDWPTWSSDSSTILFGRFDDGDEVYKIYDMDADGSNQTELTDNSADTYTNPVFSPDGTKIAFRLVPDDDSEYHEIAIMDPDGSNVNVVTDDLDIGARDLTWQPITEDIEAVDDATLEVGSDGDGSMDISEALDDPYDDIDNDSIEIITDPENGSIEVDEDGTITYTKDEVAANDGFLSNLSSLFFPKVSAQATDDSFEVEACSIHSDEICAAATVSVSFASPAASLAGTGQNSTLFTVFAATLIAGGLVIVRKQSLQ